MTAPALAPYQPPALADHDSFAHLLRAEWTKFRTVRGWVIATVVAMLVTSLLGVYTGARSQEGCPNGPCHPVIPTGPGGEAVTDTFYFVHRPLTEAGSITVRVASLSGLVQTTMTSQGQGQTHRALQPWSKAGLIVTAGAGQGSAYAAVMVTGGHGTQMQWNYTGGTAGLAGLVSTASPRWLRLIRAGDALTGYDSADGTNWIKIGTVDLARLPSTVQAGLFVTSPQYTPPPNQAISGGFGNTSYPTDATAAFDRVSLRGGWPGGGWTGTFAGGGNPASGNPGYPTMDTTGFHQADGTFTVTGSGDIAPGAVGGTPVNQTLAGVFIGLIAVVVIGALFITAEYRRGLIRATFAASPRRGRVLAAKALVLGAVTFIAGLAGAAVAVWLGDRLLRTNGSAIYPASPLTVVQVIAGTAGLFAVAAVFALGVGALLRHGAGTVTVVITAIILPYLLTVAFPVLPAGAADWLLRLTPAAGFAIQQAVPQYSQVDASYTPFNGYYPLAPWAGFAVLCGYAALALGLAVFLLRRRDA
jgi:ABC-type transport system involved in multi-copper enzyme maturation permease subunit